MSRVKITEYRAKKLLLGGAYRGQHFDAYHSPLMRPGRYVAKVDQGVKGRFKQGLVGIDVTANKASALMKQWEKKGFTHFLIEPYITHTKIDEQYISLERVRGGVQVLYAHHGGVDIESNTEAVTKYLITNTEDISAIAKTIALPEIFLKHVFEVFEKNHFSFLEINPFVIKGNSVHILDAAVLVDSTAVGAVSGSWTENDVVEKKNKYPAERAVLALSKTTPASLQLTVLNPNGSLFFLLSGGGGSIVIADEAHQRGAGSLIGNYGEYSGGPTREETKLYAREVLSLILKSKAPKKALIIAGGIANFTDIKETFAGIVEALDEKKSELQKKKVKVFVRRGGPNEEEGLMHLSQYLKKEKLLGSVHGSQAVITKAVDDAISFIQK